MQEAQSGSLVGDDDAPVWGAPDIAKVINRKLTATYHMLEQGELDASKIGNRWVSTRKRLLRNIVAGQAA